MLEWDPSLQRETPDQQVRVAKDPEDVLQKKEVLHQATHRGGKSSSSLHIVNIRNEIWSCNQLSFLFRKVQEGAVK